MRAFGEFLYDKYETFEVDDVLIIMEPVALNILERHIAGVDDTEHAGMRKFRVTFKWPRSKSKAKAQTYDEEVRYVLAHSSREARARIEEFVRNKRNKRIAGVKSNINAEYLTKFKLNRKQMDIKTKSVETWNDFVALCDFITQKRLPNPVRYFDQNDLSIFINKYKRSADFMEILQQLPKPIQLLMKRIYFHVTNGDLSADNHTELNAPSKHSGMPTRDVLRNKARGLGKKFPKPILKDLSEDPPSLGTVQDVIKMGKSYGFTYKELKSAKEYVDEHEVDPLHNEKVRAFREIRDRIQKANMAILKRKDVYYRGKGGLGRKNAIWDGDQGSFDQFGGDAWYQELDDEFPWLKSMGDGDSYGGMFALMREGMPKKPSSLTLWTKALEMLLHWKRESGGSTYKPSDNIDDDEPIPF